MKCNIFLGVIVLLVFVKKTKAQQFLNPGLEVADTTGIISSQLPPNWLNVPSDDPICNASQIGLDSPDLLSLTGPSPSIGNIGNPHSGNTFVSGVHSLTSFANRLSVFQEGIMQTVSGFIPGTRYNINLYQSVVKQNNLLDNAGSWIVYADSTLIGVTQPTFSSAPFNSTAIKWEKRILTFTATDTVHTIKFLPLDNDTNIRPSPLDTLLGLRMGIDSVYINCYVPINLGDNATLCIGESLVLDATTNSAIYLWSDSSTASTLTVTEAGSYAVEVAANGCTGIDTIVIVEEDCEVILELPNIFTPNGDGNNDRFIPIKINGIKTIETTIFNRWGAKVFSTTNPLIEWDGITNSGVEVAEGTYFLVINYTTDDDDSHEAKDIVTVLR